MTYWVMKTKYCILENMIYVVSGGGGGVLDLNFVKRGVIQNLDGGSTF